MDFRLAILLFVTSAASNNAELARGTDLVIRDPIHTEFISPLEGSKNGCVCVDFHCGCCTHLLVKTIRLNDTICVNASYLKEDYGFSLTMTFDKYTIFNETLSLRNPPPICVGAPYVEDMADVCARVYDIKASKSHLHACVDVEVEFKHIRIAKYEIGCFNMIGEQLQMALRQMENEVL